MNSCHPPSKTLINLCQMHQTQSHRRKAKYLKRHKGSMSSIKGVCHLSRRAKRRLFCKLQLWMWRKRREKCRFAIFRTKKQAVGMSSSSCLSVEGQPQKNKSSVVSPLGCDTGYDTLRRKNCSLKLCHCGSVSEKVASSSSQNQGMDVVNATTTAAEMPSPKTETLERLNELKDPLKRSHGVKPLLTLDSDVCGLTTHFEEPRTLEVSQSFGIYGSLGQLTPASRGQDQTPNINADERITRKPTMCFKPDASIAALTKVIHEFLDDFYRIYGSFIPLQKSDLLTHLKRRFNTDFGDRKNTIFLQVTKCQTTITQKPTPSFRVVYKKHTLILDDLSTLADQNWLNDQVMNMYGELIMESANHKVHFLNSFFHRQLMTKGYDGVKRWTKQVDLFSKSLLLVPIHLEVHWCLVTADSVRKKIYLYDSQGNGLQKVARNILKYLMTEAKERKQTAFENGWVVSFEENIPQQTNENDCGVFVLEYSRCLALGKPLQFSQKDIPNIRKRIYKELCDCKLHAQS